MGSKSGHRRQMSVLAEVGPVLLANLWRSFRGRSLAGSVALVGAATTLSAMPAYADALQDWGYDTQTQALTLTLPDTVTPTVSIVAPDQLVMELPNTQVGDVMGQTVEDGLVESILVEQATPETVWLVMEFAEGTVLSTDQNAVPLLETVAGAQQWQLRPAFVAASRRAAQSSPIVAVPTPQPNASPASSGASASDLRAPENVAQAPDFSELPVLEPAVIADEPVRVPPLRPAAVAAPQAFPEVVATPEPSVPESESVASEDDEDAAENLASAEVTDTDDGAIAVEVIPADTPLNSPVVSAPVNVPEAEPAPAVSVPEEPPFIVADDESSEPESIESDAIAVASPAAELPTDEIPTIESEELLPDAIAIPTVPAEPAVSAPAPSERLASEPRLTDEQVRAAQFDNEPLEEEVQVIEQAPFEQVTPANVSRWPEPIPFGQPLP